MYFQLHIDVRSAQPLWGGLVTRGQLEIGLFKFADRPPIPSVWRRA